MKHVISSALIVGAMMAILFGITVFRRVHYSEGFSSTSYVLYMAKWCGHCKKFAPVWDEIRAELGGAKNLETVEITTPAGSKLAKEAGVHSFPTIHAVTGGNRGAAKAFKGPRTKEAVKSFILGN